MQPAWLQTLAHSFPLSSCASFFPPLLDYRALDSRLLSLSLSLSFLILSLSLSLSHCQSERQWRRDAFDFATFQLIFFLPPPCSSHASSLLSIFFEIFTGGLDRDSILCHDYLCEQSDVGISSTITSLSLSLVVFFFFFLDRMKKRGFSSREIGEINHLIRRDWKLRGGGGEEFIGGRAINRYR